MIEDYGFGRAIVRGLRSGWARNADARARVTAHLHEHPGRAEGRVADWSVARITEYLRRESRRRLCFAETDACELSGDERQIMSVLEGLRDRQEQSAHLKAEWLVRGPKVAGLIERMRPLADIANAHDISDAELHRRSARALVETAQHGAL